MLCSVTLHLISFQTGNNTEPQGSRQPANPTNHLAFAPTVLGLQTCWQVCSFACFFFNMGSQDPNSSSRTYLKKRFHLQGHLFKPYQCFKAYLMYMGRYRIQVPMNLLEILYISLLFPMLCLITLFQDGTCSKQPAASFLQYSSELVSILPFGNVT